jgi:hypothetical protein
MPGPNTGIFPVKMTGVTAGVSAQQAIGANPTRNGLIVTNLHATQTASISNSGNASPTSLGAGTITIPANSSVQFGWGLSPGPSGATVGQFGFAWTDAVNVIASGASTPMTFTEF